MQYGYGMWIRRRWVSSLSYFVFLRITAVPPVLNINVESWVCAVCLHGPTHRSGCVGGGGWAECPCAQISTRKANKSSTKVFAGFMWTANERAAAGFHSCTFVPIYVKETKIRPVTYFRFFSQTHLICCHFIPQSLMQAAGYSEPWSSNCKDN